LAEVYDFSFSLFFSLLIPETFGQIFVRSLASIVIKIICLSMQVEYKPCHTLHETQIEVQAVCIATVDYVCTK